MCTCASCEYTDSFTKDEKGFADWPRGNVAGPAGSKRDYAAHWSHCGAAFNRKPDPLRSAFPCTGINGPLPHPLPIVRDWIARSYAWQDKNWQPGFGKTKKQPSRLAQLAQQYRKAA